MGCASPGSEGGRLKVFGRNSPSRIHKTVAAPPVASTNKHRTPAMSKKTKNRVWKAVEPDAADIDWELEGESMLCAKMEPPRPKAKERVTVCLSHSNESGPFPEVDFYVRIGDPRKPTAQDDLTSATDWVKATLVEELVWIDEDPVLRSETREPIAGGTPWCGTYEATLSFPPGRHSIEIRIRSRRPKILSSLVLSGWEVRVR